MNKALKILSQKKLGILVVLNNKKKLLELLQTVKLEDSHKKQILIN